MPPPDEPNIAGGLSGHPRDVPGAFRQVAGGSDPAQGHQAIVQQLGELHQHYRTIVEDLGKIKDELKAIGQLDLGTGGGKKSFNPSPKMPEGAKQLDSGVVVPARTTAGMERTDVTRAAQGTAPRNGALVPQQPQIPGQPQQDGSGGSPWRGRIAGAVGVIGGTGAAMAAGLYNRQQGAAMDLDLARRNMMLGGTSMSQSQAMMRRMQERYGGTATQWAGTVMGLQGQGIMAGTQLSNMTTVAAGRMRRNVAPEMDQAQLGAMLGSLNTGATAANLTAMGIRTNLNQSPQELIQRAFQRIGGGRELTARQLRTIRPGTSQYMMLSQMLGGDEMANLALRQETGRVTGAPARGSLLSTDVGDREGSEGRQTLELAREMDSSIREQIRITKGLNDTVSDLNGGLQQFITDFGGMVSRFGGVFESGMGLLVGFLAGRGRGGPRGGPSTTGSPRTPGTSPSTRSPRPMPGPGGGGGGFWRAAGRFAARGLGALGFLEMASEANVQGQRLGMGGETSFIEVDPASPQGMVLGAANRFIPDTEENRTRLAEGRPVFGGVSRGALPEGATVTSSADIGAGIGDPGQTGGGSLLMQRTHHDASHVTGLHPEMRKRLEALFAANPRLRLNSGYRSPARQKQLWDEAVRKYGSESAARKWVAPPGKSNHNKGLAADIGPQSEYDWLKRNAPRFGLEPYAAEPWHWELAGTRSGQHENWSPEGGGLAGLATAQGKSIGGDGASASGSFGSSLTGISQSSASSIMGALGGGVPASTGGAVSSGVDGMASGTGGGGDPTISMGAGSLSALQIARYAAQAGFSGDALIKAVAIAFGESSGNPRAHNPKPPDNSYGLWQINMLGDMGPARRRQFGLASNSELFDPRKNAEAAFSISSGGSNFGPWSVYTSGKYQNYLAQAQQAVVSLGAGVGDRATTSTTAPATFTSPSVPSGGGGMRAGLAAPQSLTIQVMFNEATDAQAERFARKVSAVLKGEDRIERIGAT